MKQIAIKEFINEIEKFYKKTKDFNNHRYKSWEYCYKVFYEARYKKVDIDYLCLNLAFYLASWGMYRGSSFLLARDYKVHKKAVEKILEKKYDILLGIKCKDIKDNIQLINELFNDLKKIYQPIRKSVEDESGQSNSIADISDILISKILLGTLGCIPAYDRFFMKGIKAKINTINKKRILEELSNFYLINNTELERYRRNKKIGNIEYPQMKMLDMGFWMIGSKIKK